MEVSTLEKKEIKELTVTILSDYCAIPKVYKIYKKTEDGYIVPLLWGIKYFNAECSYGVNKIQIKTPKIKLRVNQLDCINACDVELKKSFGGGIINMKTGSGKTICSLYIIGKYKLKTLIIVNTIELMNQWVSAISTFLPDAKIGKIQGNIFDVHGKDIVVGMVQTISMRKEYTKDKFKVFSIVFIDECHHMSSEVFSEALFKTRVRYTFGLSATVERKDGLEYIFKWHIGDIIYSDADSSKKQETIFIKIEYRGNTKEQMLYNGKPKISTMITDISEDAERTRIICDKILSLDDNRRVLVLSDRISQLKQIHLILGDIISGMFIGKTPDDIKEQTRSKKIMLATYQIASEGFNHPCLNTLVFATPRSSVTQAIGRIYRKIHLIHPMIIDLVDTFSIFPYQYKKRVVIYNKEIQKQEVTNVSECLFE